jgi:hypothetical protein
VAALWDIGDAAIRQKARELSDELVTARTLSNAAWGALVRAAHSVKSDDPDFLVASETALRWIQWGWLE